MNKKPFSKSALFILVAIGALWVLLLPTFAVAGSPTRAARIPAEPIAYNGSFTLVQRDGSGCTFADAPLTGGTFALTVDWLAGTASGSLEGGGSSVMRWS